MSTVAEVTKGFSEGVHILNKQQLVWWFQEGNLEPAIKNPRKQPQNFDMWIMTAAVIGWMGNAEKVMVLPCSECADDTLGTEKELITHLDESISLKGDCIWFPNWAGYLCIDCRTGVYRGVPYRAINTGMGSPMSSALSNWFIIWE